jgi:prepilin-type N-terminal cleavage/methylation domain-containing protein
LFLGRPGAGFTLMELVVVIAIVAVLSIVALSQTQTYATRGFYDRLLSQVSYARKAAVGQRRAVCVHLEVNQSRLFYPDGAGVCPGATGVRGPDGAAPFTVAVPAGTTVNAATFQFNGEGNYLLANGTAAAAALAINLSGDDSFQITIEPVTGYVR